MPAEIIGGLNVYTVAPGSAAQWNPKDISTTCCTGPRLNYLLAGTYTLRSEGPVQILRGGGPDSWEEVPAGTEVVLERGDALLSQMMDSFEAVNEGVEEVLLLDGVLFGGDASEDPVPEEQSGVPAWYAHYQDIFLTPRPVPAGPLTLRLQQATLAPGDVILEPPGAVVQLAVSLDESAVVGGTLLKPDAFDLRNLGEKAVDLYVIDPGVRRCGGSDSRAWRGGHGITGNGRATGRGDPRSGWRESQPLHGSPWRCVDVGCRSGFSLVLPWSAPELSPNGIPHRAQQWPHARPARRPR